MFPYISAWGAYTPTHETNIRAATVLAATYDPISRPADLTEVKVGISLLAIDSLVMQREFLHVFVIFLVKYVLIGGGLRRKKVVCFH